MAKRDNEESKSRERSKELAKSIASAGSELIPVIGPAMRIAIEGAVAMRQARIDRRLRDLHERLLAGKAEDEQKTYVESLLAEDTRETYESIVMSAVEDLDDEKVWVYAAVLRGLAADKSLTRPLRRHVLTAIRALTKADLDLLVRLVIATTIVPDKNDGAQHIRVGNVIDELTRIPETDPQRAMSVQNLMTWGLLVRPERHNPYLSPLAAVILQLMGAPADGADTGDPDDME